MTTHGGPPYVSTLDNAPMHLLDTTSPYRQLTGCAPGGLQATGGAFSSGVGIVLGVALGLFVVGAIVYGPKTMLKKIHLA